MDMTAFFLGKVASEGQGSGGGGSSVQSDYLQNDPAAADYIKNRPFYEELQTTTYDPANIIEGDDTNMIPSSALDVVIGDVVQYEILQNGITLASGETVVLDGEEIEFSGHGYLYISETINEDDAEILVIDKLSTILEPSNTESIAALPYSDIMIKISSGTVKKIDKKFLPDDIATKLEVATSEDLGGVMPVEKQSSMTQEVGIDENGRLYTNPSPEVNTASATQKGIIQTTASYDAAEHNLPCAVDSQGQLWVSKPITVNTITQDSSDIPTSAAVYSFIEELLAEGEY